MKSLHILDRELRLRARQRLTFSVRQGAAGIAMLMVLAWFQNQGTSGNPAQTGQMVFSILSWLLFGFCLLEGARQTADAISVERREGTLGLLFLTELSGGDVILGKFVAAITHSFYGLLATFPVLGITLAAGGVTAAEFWRTQLALLNTLFLASTAGLWISARSRDEVRPVLAALALTLGLALAPLLIDLASPGLTLPSLSPAAGLWFATDAAYRVSAGRFWWTQAGQVTLAGLFLLGAARRIGCSWGEEEAAPTPPRAQRNEHDWNYRISPRLHAANRAKPATSNPVATLARRHRGLTLLVWVAVVLPFLSLMAFQLMVFQFVGISPGTGGMLSMCSLAFQVLNVTLLALAAGLPLAVSRRTGVLELLLCTPVGSKAIVQGHWEAYWRRLRLPLAIYAVVPSGLHMVFWGMSSARGPAGGVYPWTYLLLGLGPRVILEVVQMTAAGWLGLWYAVAAKSPGAAVGRTVLVAFLAPWAAMTVSGIILRHGLGPSPLSPSSWLAWFLWLNGPILNLLWLVGVAGWARHKLRHGLRQAVAGEPVSRFGAGVWRWRNATA